MLLLFKELLTNVARHARATSVLIEVRLTPGWLILEMRDDGCGFDLSTVQAGNGLKNIPQRAQLLGATFKLHSSSGGGTAVSLQVPI